MTPPASAARPIEIIYDGECPFCSAYVKMIRLRDAAGPVQLVNAREDMAAVEQLAREGIDIDETMAVRYGGATFAGADAIELLSMLSSDSGLANRLTARLLRNKERARALYPILRGGRNLAIRILGRGKIAVSKRGVP